mgnify:CR=1 FL=1
MKIRRFTARTSRDALRLLREALGDDAVVLSTKPCAEGVEVLAMAPEGMQQIERAAEESAARRPVLPPAVRQPRTAPVEARAAPAFRQPAAEVQPRAALAERSAIRAQERTEPTFSDSAAPAPRQARARVGLDGPYGMAWLRRDSPRDILCLAGGSGLAPMLSIARGAMAEPRLAARQLHFIYGGRTRADLCGQDMLAALPGYGKRLHWRGFVSTPPPAGSAYEMAFLHDAALSLHGPKLKDMEIYFAGPAAMATAVQRMLLDAQVPPDQMHFDQFY